MPEQEIKLVYKFEYTQPVKVTDFSYSLLGFDRQFKRHLIRNRTAIADQRVRLFIQEINKGSIEAVFIPLFANALVFSDDINSVIDFVRNTGLLLTFLKNGIITAARPFILEKPDVENARNIVAPVLKDAHSNLSIMAFEGSNMVVNYTVNSVDAANIKETSRRIVSELEAPDNSSMPDQLLYFRIAEDSLGESKYDKGIIERVSSDPVHISANEEIKQKILENPFGKMFLVDVDIHTVEGRPMLYRVTALKEIFDREIVKE
jgi:hypothetical protein